MRRKSPSEKHLSSEVCFSLWIPDQRTERDFRSGMRNWSLCPLAEVAEWCSHSTKCPSKGGLRNTTRLYRRKWRSERSAHPIKAVAFAGGWTDIATMMQDDYAGR